MRSLLVVAAVFVNTLQAAPAPKAQAEPESILGRWNYDWASMNDGFIIFYADGSYIAKHHPSKGDYWLGRWRIHDGYYIFQEGFVNVESNIFSGFCSESKFKIERTASGWVAWSTFGFCIRFSNHIPAK